MFFEDKESIADIPTELPCSGWSRKPLESDNDPDFEVAQTRYLSKNILAMDSFDLENINSGEISNIWKQNHQYLLNRKLT